MRGISTTGLYSFLGLIGRFATMSTQPARLFIYLLFADIAYAELASAVKVLMEARESETWKGAWAYLAIDDNAETIAVASISSRVPEFGSTPWWLTDMFLYFGVVKVAIVSPSNDYFSQTLENFGIYITFYDPIQNPKFDTFQSCGNSSEPMKPLTSFDYICPKTLFGRFVLIKKFEDKFKSELLALAEVTIYYDVDKKLYL